MKYKVIALLVALALLVTGCAGGATSDSAEADQIVTERLPAKHATVSLVTAELQEFLDEYTWGKGTLYLDAEVPALENVTFSWKCEKENSGFTLVYATNEDLTDAVEIETTETSVLVTDLFVATTYYWKVITHTPAGDDHSSIYSFTTAETPRFISLPGVENTRDIGGYLTEDGLYRVAQGKIYRGQRLDEIESAGIKNALDVYKIKTEMDLRYSAIDKTFVAGDTSFLGESVNYINIPGMQYYEALSNPEKIREELLVFAQEENYPIYVHCSAGKDRTGTLIFIIGALLGVPEEDLTLDFELTHVVVSGYDLYGYNGFTTFLEGFKQLEGDTLQEKAENLCRNAGITDEQIQTIRSIMLEEMK